VRRIGSCCWLLILGLACSFFPDAANAQGLQVSPISVEMLPGQMTSTLAVTNKDGLVHSLQIRPFKWDQADGTDRLVPTTELAVSPPIAQVAAGETQIFRLVLRQSATSQEASYRLLLDELPPPAAPGSVRVALRLSIPVFGKVAAASEAALTWKVVVEPSGAYLVGTNRSTAHVKVMKASLAQPARAPVAVRIADAAYILPGAERKWPIQTSSALQIGSTLRLNATLSGGPVDAAVRVSGP
jgi:fimbrial chaperone protein